MTEYVHVGSHADLLASGRPVGPGERLRHTELDDEDQYLVDDGRLVPVEGFGSGAQNEVLSGEKLKAKAAELNIEGRSQMGAEELRAAVAAAESEEAQSAA